MYTDTHESCPKCHGGEIIEVSDQSGSMDLDEPLTVAKVCSSPGLGVYLHLTDDQMATDG